jgi:hypothetical protein
MYWPDVNDDESTKERQSNRKTVVAPEWTAMMASMTLDAREGDVKDWTRENASPYHFVVECHQSLMQWPSPKCPRQAAGIRHLRSKRKA